MVTTKRNLIQLENTHKNLLDANHNLAVIKLVLCNLLARLYEVAVTKQNKSLKDCKQATEGWSPQQEGLLLPRWCWIPLSQLDHIHQQTSV